MICSRASSAREIDWSLVLNPDPSAQETGLYFHSSVPVDARKLIIDDLSWLASRDNLIDADQLGKALGVAERPVTGTRIVAWILGRLSMIVDYGWCDPRANLVISQARPELVVVFHSDAAKALCNSTPTSTVNAAILLGSGGDGPNHMMNWRSWRQADERDGEIDAFRVDDLVLVTPKTRHPFPPIVFINFKKFISKQGSDLQSSSARIERLTTLVHEATHMRGTSFFVDHVACNPESVRAIPLGGYLAREEVACDSSLLGAYATEAEFVRVLLLSCAECRDRTMVLSEMTSWLKIEIKPSRRIALGDIPGLSNKPEFKDKWLAVVPPRRAFDEWLASLDVREKAGCSTKSKPCYVPQFRAEVSALLNYLVAMRQRGELDANWDSLPRDPTPPFQPSGPAALSWLRAAVAAPTRGYNVPLRWLPPCSRFSTGCPN